MTNAFIDRYTAHITTTVPLDTSWTGWSNHVLNMAAGPYSNSGTMTIDNFLVAGTNLVLNEQGGLIGGTIGHILRGAGGDDKILGGAGHDELRGCH
jgi:hypothetical protein